jgi:hypothetical protein
MTTLDSRPQADLSIKLIDARGPRFGAILTTLMLAATLLTIPSTISIILLSIQTLVFGLGSLVGLAAQPYGVIYRRFVQPKLGKPTDLEDPRPPRFAQSVGLMFAVVGLFALLTGATTVAFVAVGAALAAAFLNAAFNFCLGCEMYLIGRRILGRSSASV